MKCEICGDEHGSGLEILQISQMDTWWEERIEDTIKAELIYWMIAYPKQKKLLKEFTDKLILELKLRRKKE